MFVNGLEIAPALIMRRRRYGGLAVRVHSHAGGKEMTILTKQGLQLREQNVIESYQNEALKNFQQRRFISSLNQPSIQYTSPNNSLEITYTDDEGNQITKVGGHKAWRTNNPGNLSFSSLEAAKETGAIGIYDDGMGHKYGIYSSEEKGMQALSNKLDEKRFSYYSDGQRRPIKNMIAEIYAPASDNNNPIAYANFIQSKGIDVTKTVDELSKKDKEKLMQAIYTMEGRKKGTIKRG